jgi:UDP-N-acetylmuramoyl-tripeptide--D-alanyl-D-alanine ligase
MEYPYIESLYSLFLNSGDVVIDSRKVVRNSLFFALRGERSDGNVFAESAVMNGAIAAVVDDPSLEGKQGCFYVPDVLTALQQLARFHRNTFSFPVIGLTGSNGKTTSKELLYVVLASEKKVKATKGNLNNHIGVPLTLLDVKESLDFLIVEMGANHQMEIDFLCSLCKPDFGFITNIGKAHLEGFGGIEGVKKGKSELYRFIEKNGGKLFVNAEDEVLISLLPDMDKTRIMYYRPRDYFSDVRTESSFLHFSFNGKDYESHLVGDYNLANIAAAISIGLYCNVPGDKIGRAIQEYQPANHRSQWMEYQGTNIIMDAYNANPTSMKASISNFAANTSTNKIIILGDMFELGEYTDEEHRNLIEFIRQFDWKAVIFVGNNFIKVKSDTPNHYFFETPEEVVPLFKSFKNTGSTILIKGSRGIALEKLIEK